MSGVTWPMLLAVDVGPARQAAVVWDRLGTAADDQADELAATVKRLPEAWPSGPASEAAAAHMSALRAELDNCFVPVLTIGQTLAQWADGMAELQAQAQSLTADARSAHITIAGDGSMRMDPGSAGTTTPQSFAGLVRLRDELQQRAADLDARLAAAIAANAASAAGTPAARVDPSAIPPRGADPAAVKRWWDALTPAQQRYLIMNDPERIGWLDGVPATGRDIANRIMLDRDTDATSARLAGITAREKYLRDMLDQGRIWEVYPGASDPRTQMDAELLRLAGEQKHAEGILKGLTRIDERLADTTAPRAYLLGLSTADDGKAIVAIGDPDRADNVVTYVPGTGSDLSKVRGDIGRADALTADAMTADPSATTSAVFWLGYDAPDSIPGAGRSGYAEDAAPELNGFQTGLRVTHEGDDPSRNTVLGHSYGSTVVSHAALSDSINADAVVFVASPGGDVNHVSELTGVQPGQVYATRAQNDLIARIPDLDVIHGNDPTRDDFGAQVFSSAPGDPDDEAGTHSAYWDRGNIARNNIAFIVTGQTNMVS